MDLTVHPDQECRKQQAEFLKNCHADQRRFHQLLFIHGNITYHYHRQANEFNPSVTDWEEWIEGLDEPMRSHFKKEGFEKGKRVLSFTRYVNEKNDIGLDEFVRQHMDPSDYQEYQALRGAAESAGQ